MTDRELEVEKQKLWLEDAQRKLANLQERIAADRRVRQAENAVAQVREDRELDEARLEVARYTLYLKHAEAERARGFEI